MLMRQSPQALMPRPPIDAEFETWQEPFEVAAEREFGYVRRLVEAVFRRRWLAAAVLAIVFAGAIGYLMTVTPIYEAHVKLLIEPDTPNVVSFKEVIEQNTSKLDYYSTQLGILRSRSLARKTIDTLGLWTHHEFVDDPARAGTISRFAYMKTVIAAWLGQTAVVPAGDEGEAESRAIDAFLERLTLSYRTDNRLVDVRFESSDPRLAMAIVNTLARTYIDDKTDLKLAASKDASGWLRTRLAEQRERLNDSEAALQRYREQNADVSVEEQQNINAQRLADLSTSMTRARTERIEAEALYQQVRAIQDNPAAFDTLPVILSNPFIQQLKTEHAALQREQAKLAERLGDQHPDMIKIQLAIQRVETQLKLEVAKIAEAASNQKAAVDIKERSLQQAIDAQKQQAMAISRRAIEYEGLQREATSNRQMFEALMQRAKETEISSELKATNVRIVDPAELPRKPTHPSRLVVFALALLFGLPLAGGAAILRDYVDDRITSADEITGSLGVKVLGFSPNLPKEVANTDIPFVSANVSYEFSEAFRALRSNLLLSEATREKRSVVVTSTVPGEGKTLVATNLAVALAHAGRRVLLIDADMRRPQLHRIFHERLQPGLAAVLDGHAPIDTAVRASAIPHLFLLPAGVPPATPGDLFELPAFSSAMDAVREQYDWIVIDSPPVMAAADTITLAHAAEAVVFVVGAHMIGPREAKAALEQLKPSGAKIIGAVLSRADVNSRSAYGYGKYGYAKYGKQYAR